MLWAEAVPAANAASKATKANFAFFILSLSSCVAVATLLQHRWDIDAYFIRSSKTSLSVRDHSDPNQPKFAQDGANDLRMYADK